MYSNLQYILNKITKGYNQELLLIITYKLITMNNTFMN